MNTENRVGQNAPPSAAAPQNAPAPIADVPGAGVRSLPYPPQYPPFAAGRADGLMALGCVLLGFLTVRWGLALQGWGMAGLCAAYAAAVLLYARAKGVRPPAASRYWLCVFMLCAAACALWTAGMLGFWRAALTFGAAVYWCGHVFGVTVQGKTGNWMPLDCARLVFYLPFVNAGAAVRTLGALRAKKSGGGQDKGGRHGGVRRALPAAAGAAAAVLLLAVLVPMLTAADPYRFGGIFGGAVRAVSDFFEWMFSSWDLPWQMGTALVQLLWGLPLAALCGGLVMGCAHRRRTAVDTERIKKDLAAVPRIPNVTLTVALGGVCALYLVFIGCQLPYFFSGFAGAMPAGYEQYSAYARAGFFELCGIAAINMALLAAGCAAKTPPRAGGPLKWVNLALCALTQLVIITAFSKMALYIMVHGLTPKRVLTCVFMLFLAGVCAAAAAAQLRVFSVVRFAAVWGAGLLCALCMCNLDGAISRYNAGRYLDGSLDVYDEIIVYNAGPAAVPAALDVYAALPDGDDKIRLGYAITIAAGAAEHTEGTPRDTVAAAAARAAKLPVWESDAEFEEGARLFWDKNSGRTFN